METYKLTLFQNDPAFVFDLKDAKSGVLSFDAVRELRDLHDYVIALSAHCNGDLKVIDTLRSLNSNNKKRHILTSYSDLLQGYNESLAVLQNRIQNVIDLVRYLKALLRYSAIDGIRCLLTLHSDDICARYEESGRGCCSEQAYPEPHRRIE